MGPTGMQKSTGWYSPAASEGTMPDCTPSTLSGVIRSWTSPPACNIGTARLSVCGRVCARMRGGVWLVRCVAPLHTERYHCDPSPCFTCTLLSNKPTTTAHLSSSASLGFCLNQPNVSWLPEYAVILWPFWQCSHPAKVMPPVQNPTRCMLMLVVPSNALDVWVLSALGAHCPQWYRPVTYIHVLQTCLQLLYSIHTGACTLYSGQPSTICLASLNSSSVSVPYHIKCWWHITFWWLHMLTLVVRILY